MVKIYLLSLLFFAFNPGDVGAQNAKRISAGCTTPTVSLSADYCTNPGKVILTAEGTNGVSYSWSTGETTQSITVDVVGNYSVTATTSGGCSATTQMEIGQELVTNGSFTDGNVGFTTGYAYKADSAGYNKELYDDSGNNGYGVGTEGQNYHTSFYGEDHTDNQSGDRNFMLVNGHGNIVVWEETVSVQPNTNYYYSAWGMNLNPSSPARLQFEVNGEKIGTIADLNKAPKPSSQSQVNINNWVRFYYGNTSGWNSGSATTAVIRIIDLNSDLNGNDFGLDDISFATLSPFLIGPVVPGTDNQEVCPGEAIQSITYKVGSSGTPDVEGLPVGLTSDFDGLNLVISGTPTVPGLYSYQISTPCFSTMIAQGVVNVKNPGIWTGAISTDWDEAGNWCCGSVPTQSTNVEIRSGLLQYPVISNSTIAYCNDISIDPGEAVVLCKGSKLKISGNIEKSGIIDATKGTIEMNGTVQQNISGNSFLNRTLYNLVVSNSNPSGLEISDLPADTLNISGQLSFGDPNSKLSTGDNLTLLSNHSSTASIGIVGPGNSISGKAIVEKYLNIGTDDGQHPKSWEFLSTPTMGQTVKESWMEQGNTPSNYGTQITGPAGKAAGFDFYSVAPSLKYFNSLTNSWIGISSPGDLLYNPEGYMVFVRGDRTVTSTSQLPINTTLRSKGNLITGSLSTSCGPSGTFTSIGNPYASPIDFTSIAKVGIDNKFYLWDPYLSGNFGVGGFQTFSDVNDWKPVPGGTPAYPTAVPNKIIESGQAFLTYSSPDQSTPTLNFSESCKTNNSGNVSRLSENEPSNKQFFNAYLFLGPGAQAIMADGNVVVFSSKFSDKVDRNDAPKLMNSGENFGIIRDGKLLSIEARAPVTPLDTIYYSMSNLSQRSYELRFAPRAMKNTGLEAILYDNYLKKETPLTLSDSSFIDVSITSDPVSSAANRFKIYFRHLAVMPITLISFSAKPKESDILLEWKVENQNEVSEYEVQSSDDGVQFTDRQVLEPTENTTSLYQWVDENVIAGNHFYRIRIKDKNGKITYSKIIKAIIKRIRSSVTIYPNPVTAGVINVQLQGYPTGKYIFNIRGNSGRLVASETINHKEGEFEKIGLNSRLARGAYQLEVISPDGKVTVKKVLYK